MGPLSAPATPPMLLERYAGAVAAWAPAKLNVFLEVLARRADGYHEVATLMVAVSLFDTLLFEEGAPGRLELTCDDPRLPAGPENLVCRAADRLRERTGCTKGARVRLVKRIPLAAGLAGGSSDAAAALAGLNRLWGLGLGAGELAALAAEVGSDVPFFLGGPAAWCTGRGERVAPAQVGGRFWFVLVCPPFGLSTAAVYGRVRPPATPVDGADVRAALGAGDADALGRHLHNRLQEAAEELRPELAGCRARLAACRSAGCLMSGSGTTLFAVCRDRAEALRVAHELRNGPEEGSPPRVFLVRSCA